MTIEIYEKDGRWYFAGHQPHALTHFTTHVITVPDDATIQIIRRAPLLCLPAATHTGEPLTFPAAAVWLAAKKGTIHGIHRAATIV